MKSGEKKKLTQQDFWNAAGVQGKLDVVKECIEKEGMAVDCRDPEENDTALIKAAYWARFEICQYLLEKGADINAVDNSLGFSPLHHAAYRGSFNHIRIVKFLLEKGADPNMKSKRDDKWDVKSRTPYQAASQKGHKAIIQAFEEKGIRE